MTQYYAAWFGLLREEVINGDWHEGQGLVEYVLLLGFIAIAVIVALIFFADRLTAIYSKIGNSIPT